MAFDKYAPLLFEVRTNDDDEETGLVVRGYITDTAHPGLKERFDFVIEGPEHSALSAVPATRQYQTRGIIRREVMARHAAWVASLAEPAETVEAQNPDDFGGDIEDLDDPATPYDPDLNSWEDGWGEPPAGGSPEFVSAALSFSRTAVIVNFSEGVSSPGLGLTAGVTIKVNGATVGIDSPEAGEGPEVVNYYIFNPVAEGAAVTWEYNAGAGDLQDVGGNVLASTGPHVVA